MRILLAILCVSICLLNLYGNTGTVNLPNHTGLTPFTENGVNSDSVKIEYDDGTNIIFNVKIAIDQEGLNMRDMDFFKTHLKKQWENINIRFNGLDKKGMLKRNYTFVPDLQDIIVYEKDDNISKPSSSHWEVPKNHNEKINRSKFQCLVVYDFAVQEGEGGGGFGDDDGLGNILVINPGTQYIGKFYDHFADKANTVAAITHELGHFRGILDTYLTRVKSQNNPVSGQGFEPEPGNMNNPYPVLADAAWSDYEMRVINLNGARKDFRMIYKTVRDYFPDYIDIELFEDGKRVENSVVKVYKVENYRVIKEAVKTFQSKNGLLRLGGHETFWHNDWVKWPWTYYNIILVEATNTKSGNKAYSFIPIYEVHNKGIIDKSENKIVGKSIFKRTIEIQDKK